MISGFLFILMRCIELFFLIPIIGMMAYFVNGFVSANQLTPTFILVLFIVATLAGVWSFFTLLFYLTARHHGYFLAFVDLCIFGALIAGVYELGPIGGASCGSVDISLNLYRGSGMFVIDWSKTCSLLKASFALGIMEILFFWCSFWLALWVHHHHRNDDDKRYRSHSSRRSSRRRDGGGGSRSGGYRYDDRSYRSSSRTRRDNRSYV